ncbi:MAG: hypothetical protein ACFE0R_02370 [Salinarimonas sp.]
MPSHRTAAPHDDRRARLRVRDAVVAVFTLACFAAASPGQAQMQPGAPSADVPLAAPAQPVAVEIAMSLEQGRLVCRPDRAPLPAEEQLTLQIVNGTDTAGAFAAPTFFAAGTVASTVEAEYDHDEGAFIVAPGTIGQIVLTTGEPGEHDFACAPAGESASFRGTLVLERS